MTRPDSALLVMVILPVAIFFLLSDNKISIQKKLLKIIVLVLPFIGVVGSWIIWKLSFYGEFLPNTFYIKVSSITSPKRGLYYIYIFLLSYWLIPYAFLFILSLKTLLNKVHFKVLILSVLILLWLLYVIKIGGDFMEFRFMVPILPLLFILITWLIFVLIQRKEIQIALIVLVLLGSLHHALTFGRFTYSNKIETIQQLYGNIKNRDNNWCEIGRILGESFNYNPSIIIAKKPAGAIPYYFPLKTIDMFGLK